MDYLVNKDGSLKGFHFSIKGVEYLTTACESAPSRNVWDSITDVKRLDTGETRRFTRYQMKDWVVTIINNINTANGWKEQ